MDRGGGSKSPLGAVEKTAEAAAVVVVVELTIIGSLVNVGLSNPNKSIFLLSLRTEMLGTLLLTLLLLLLLLASARAVIAADAWADENEPHL